MVHTYHTIYEDYTHYLTHNRIIDKRAKAFARVFTRVCCNHVEQVIVPTSKVKRLLLEYNVNRDISVVPTGVNLQKFNKDLYHPDEILKAKKEIGVKETDKVLLYIGRISREKNIDEIIDAMPIYMKDKSNVKFVLIGGGPDFEWLKQKAKDYGLEDRILFTGPRPWDKIGLYYQIGDVFVSGSTSETQGLTYIEAMSAGLPVVAREDKCLEDILDIGKNGYSFTNQEELLKALDIVLFDPMAKEFGEHSRYKMKKYSTEEFGKSIELVYDEVMKRDEIMKQREASETKKISSLFPS